MFSFVSGGNYTLRKWGSCNIVADGNSNVINSGSGTDAGSPFTTYLSDHLATHLDITKVTITNIGVGGQKTSDMLTDFDSQVVPLYDSSDGNTHPNLLIVWEIGNDQYYTSDQTTVYNRIVQYCQAGQTAGYKVLIMTCPTRYYSANTSAGDTLEQYNTKLEATNTLIRLNWRTYADGICDVAYDVRFRNPLDTTYFRPDGIHITETGRRIIGEELISNAMKRIKL